MKRYKDSKSVYAAYGVDTEAALASLADITVSIHCWQGDDVPTPSQAAFRPPAITPARQGRPTSLWLISIRHSS